MALERTPKTENTDPAKTDAVSALLSGTSPAQPVPAEQNAAPQDGGFNRPTDPIDDVVRRETHEQKQYRDTPSITPGQRIQRQVDRSPESEQTHFYMFISPYKDLQIYLDFGMTERDKDGTVIPRYLPIKFSNGVFKTQNATVADRLRHHPRCGTQTFREELNTRTVALRAAAAAQRDNLRAPTYAGASTSTDGLESQFHSNDHELAAVEQKIFTL